MLVRFFRLFLLFHWTQTFMTVLWVHQVVLASNVSEWIIQRTGKPMWITSLLIRCLIKGIILVARTPLPLIIRLFIFLYRVQWLSKRGLLFCGLSRFLNLLTLSLLLLGLLYLLLLLVSFLDLTLLFIFITVIFTLVTILHFLRGIFLGIGFFFLFIFVRGFILGGLLFFLFFIFFFTLLSLMARLVKILLFFNFQMLRFVDLVPAWSLDQTLRRLRFIIFSLRIFLWSELLNLFFIILMLLFLSLLGILLGAISSL